MTTAVVNIGQLVTLAGPARPRIGLELGELGLIRDAAMLINEGRIVAAAPYTQILPEIPHPMTSWMHAENALLPALSTPTRISSSPEIARRSLSSALREPPISRSPQLAEAF